MTARQVPLRDRRAVLRALASILGVAVAPAALGCGPPPAKAPAPLPPLRLSPLTSLIAAGDLRWMAVGAPSTWFAVPWFPALVALALPDARFDRFATTTGIDLRTIDEAILAAYPMPAKAPASDRAPDSPAEDASEAGSLPEGSPPPIARDEVRFYLVRHRDEAAAIERAFRARLSGSEKRSEDRPDLVRTSGKIGRERHALVLLGQHVAGFQIEGSVVRGPARVAALFAEGKLHKSKPALTEGPLADLARRFGAAPLVAYASGPFDGELARGLRGLLGAATALGAAATPTERTGVIAHIVVGGDFSKSADGAAKELLGAWSDLAGRSFGKLMGLDAPLAAPVAEVAADAVAMRVELDAKKLASGLAAATAQRVEEIFR